jgi:hypothetical protein
MDILLLVMVNRYDVRCKDLVCVCVCLFVCLFLCVSLLVLWEGKGGDW